MKVTIEFKRKDWKSGIFEDVKDIKINTLSEELLLTFKKPKRVENIEAQPFVSDLVYELFRIKNIFIEEK